MFIIMIRFTLLQNIIYYEYLPALLGEELPAYKGYQPDVHPGVTHVFQAAAFRFGHTMIPPGIYRRDGQCRFKDTRMGFKGIRLCSTWWDSTVSLPNIINKINKNLTSI